MNEEARANLLAFANELEEQGEDGQAQICRDAASRLPGESRIPLPNQTYISGEWSLLCLDGFVPQFA